MNETLEEQRREVELVVRRALACPRCNGSGTVSGDERGAHAHDDCGLCHGSGLFADEAALSRLIETLLGEV